MTNYVAARAQLLSSAIAQILHGIGLIEIEAGSSLITSSLSTCQDTTDQTHRSRTSDWFIP